MNHVVARNFKSLNRRFTVGEPIKREDIHPGSKIAPDVALQSGLVRLAEQIEQAAGKA
jgi:hypothetical protein